MVNSDHSEVEEEDMDILNISTDPIQLIPTKRLRTDSEDEQDTPAKKRRYSPNKESEMSETHNTSDKNGIDKNNLNEEKDTSSEKRSAQDEKSIFDLNVKAKNKEEQEDKMVDIEKESPIKDENDTNTDESAMKNTNKTTESEVIIIFI